MWLEWLYLSFSMLFLLGFMFSPSCQCCEDCILFEDDFNRANSTTVGNGWTEVAGDWEIVSNELQIDEADAIASNSASTG